MNKSSNSTLITDDRASKLIWLDQSLSRTERIFKLKIYFATEATDFWQNLMCASIQEMLRGRHPRYLRHFLQEAPAAENQMGQITNCCLSDNCRWPDNWGVNYHAVVLTCKRGVLVLSGHPLSLELSSTQNENLLQFIIHCKDKHTEGFRQL